MKCGLVDLLHINILGCLGVLDMFMSMKVNCIHEPKDVFSGYPKGVKGFKLWSLNFKKTIISRDVIFDEFATILDLKTKNSNEPQQLVQLLIN